MDLKDALDIVLDEVCSEIRTCAIMTGVRKDRLACPACEYHKICAQIFEKEKEEYE